MTESADSGTKNNTQDAAGVSDVLPAGTVLGDYTILRVLGQGGFGVTYLAHDAGLDQDVVLKENLPAQFAGRGGDSLAVTSRGGKDGADNFAWATQRFLDEARLLARLSHPNIVRVLRAFSALGTAYYVMPWVGGRDLKQFAAARGGVDEAFLRGVLSKLLPALSYLHGNNLLHRDIKPGNILCADDGTPILIDFGTARALVSERSQTMMESAGYTPMEQIQSHGNTGPWTDLYALGATLYTLVTGEHPPRSSDRMGRADCYTPLAGRAELRGRYSAAFLASIDKALAVWPEDRWQSAGEWLQALGNRAEPEPAMSSAPPDSAAPSPVPALVEQLARLLRKKRCIWLWGVSALLIVGGSLTAVCYYNPSDSAVYAYRKGQYHLTVARYLYGGENWARAANWFREAALQGLANAQYSLGECYENGWGVDKDPWEAVRWYRKAAEQGHADAEDALERLEDR